MNMTESEQNQIFYNWFKKYKGLLSIVILTYAFNLHDQEDLFQVITIQICNSIPNFLGESAISTWVYRVSLYTAIAWSKKKKNITLANNH